jgi:WD40 repeat protein
VRRQEGTVEERRLNGRLVRTGGDALAEPVRAISPDGDVGALARPDGTVKLFDPHGSHVLRVLRGHAGAVNSVAFSPDGKLLVTASDDHDARIWNVQTGHLVQKLHGHFGPVLDATFSPDGRWVVTAGPITAGLWLVGEQRTAPFLGCSGQAAT